MPWTKRSQVHGHLAFVAVSFYFFSTPNIGKITFSNPESRVFGLKVELPRTRSDKVFSKPQSLQSDLAINLIVCFSTNSGFKPPIKSNLKLEAKANFKPPSLPVELDGQKLLIQKTAIKFPKNRNLFCWNLMRLLCKELMPKNCF